MSSSIQTLVLVLNFHQPEATLACIRSLLACGDAASQVLWLENDANATWHELSSMLNASGLSWTCVAPDDQRLPSAEKLGVMPIPTNVGYAAGNNLGAQLAHRCGIPYVWILNNDTLLEQGSPRELRRLAEDQPEIGAWGTEMVGADDQIHIGCRLSALDFRPQLVTELQMLKQDPLAYLHGCSLFISTDRFAALGFLPEHYFLYYEDPDFSQRLRQSGYEISANPLVRVRHMESLGLGKKAKTTYFYLERNRWFFIQSYFQECLPPQRRRFLYTLQRDFFRGRVGSVYIALRAYLEFRKGAQGRSPFV